MVKFGKIQMAMRVYVVHGDYSIRGNRGLPFLIASLPICSRIDLAVFGIKGEISSATFLITSINTHINSFSSSALFSFSKFQGLVSSIYLFAILISSQIFSNAKLK